jgi:hypothetical protein
MWVQTEDRRGHGLVRQLTDDVRGCSDGQVRQQMARSSGMRLSGRRWRRELYPMAVQRTVGQLVQPQVTDAHGHPPIRVVHPCIQNVAHQHQLVRSDSHALTGCVFIDRQPLRLVERDVFPWHCHSLRTFPTTAADGGRHCRVHDEVPEPADAPADAARCP